MFLFGSATNPPMRALCVVALVSITATIALAQHRLARRSTAPPAPQSFDTLELRNPDVLVRKLDIPADAFESVPATVHDYILVSFGDNALRVTGYQTDFQLSFANGDIEVLNGGWPHKLNNESGRVAQLAMVEVERNLFPKSASCGLGAKSCGETRFGKSAEGEYSQATLFETDTAKLFRVQLDSQVGMHQHNDGRPHLLIAITSFEGHADAEAFSMQPGETHWIPRSIDELTNDGSSQARFLILELKQKY